MTRAARVLAAILYRLGRVDGSGESCETVSVGVNSDNEAVER